MIYKIARAVGLNSDQRASLVSSVPKGADNLLMGVLQLTCDDAFTRGRQLLSELSDNFFEEEGSTSEKLTGILQKAKQSLQDVSEYSLLLALVSGKVLYLIGQGQVKIYLKRLDQVSPLMEEGNEQILSGFLQEGDRVLLSTAGLTLFLGDDLKNLLDLPQAQWEEEVSARVAEHTDDLAGLILDIESEEKQEPHLEAIKDEVKLNPKFNIKMPNFRVLGKLKQFFPQGGKGKLIIAAVLIMVIGLGLGLKIKNAKEAEKENSFQNYLREAKDDFEQAQGLQTLNPNDAGVKLQSAKKKIDEALKLKPNAKEAQDLKAQIEQNAPSISQKYDKVNFQEYLSLDLIKQGFSSRNLSLSDSKVLLLDENNKTLVLLNLDKKSNQIIAGKDNLGDAIFASLNGNLAFVFSKDKGVLRVDVASQKIVVVAKPDKEWGEIAGIYGFAGNIYLLDKLGNQVWKYIPASDGYSDKRKYLNEGVKVDFASAKNIQIESSVYILKQGGEINRFTKGATDFFSLGGLDKPLKEAKTIFTSSETDNLYILDADNSRLLVTSKVGAYKQQYQGDKFAATSDLVVDEEGKKVYLLEGNKIYTMELQ